MSMLTLDLLLIAVLLWLGWQCLNTDNLFRAAVLFIIFGMMMALVWARLAAPDLALAEAAVGAGITGALLLSALTRKKPPPSSNDQNPEQPQ